MDAIMEDRRTHNHIMKNASCFTEQFQIIFKYKLTVCPNRGHKEKRETQTSQSCCHFLYRNDVDFQVYSLCFNASQ